MQISEQRRPALAFLVAPLFALIVAFHLGGALCGKPLYRASHLGTALTYARTHISLLRPVIVGFNATETPTALELPVWQAAAGLAFKITHSTWFGLANLVSLCFFATCLWPFFQLARQYVGDRAAGWATACFLAEPIAVVMAGEAATDGLCLVAMVWFVFCAERMIRTGNAWWWLSTAAFAALNALLKVPLFFAAGLFTVFLLAATARRAWRQWALLAGAGAVALLAFVLWTRHTNSLAAQAVYPYVELRLSHSQWIRHWFFGDLHYRLGLGHWLKGGWRFVHATMGALPMSALLLLALFRSGNPLPKLWLLATFITTLVFTQLVLEHWHFYLMCAPAVAMLCGAMLARWEDFWAQEMPIPSLRGALALLVLAGAAVNGVISMKIVGDYDWFPKDMSEVLRAKTNPGDRLLVYTCDPLWGGEVLFRSDRRGLCVPILEAAPGGPTPKGLFDLLRNPADLHRLKSLGYDKLVLISESPVRYAVVAANPASHRKREHYPERISPAVDAWPEVYRTDDILIRQMP